MLDRAIQIHTAKSKVFTLESELKVVLTRPLKTEDFKSAHGYEVAKEKELEEKSGVKGVEKGEKSRDERDESRTGNLGAS